MISTSALCRGSIKTTFSAPQFSEDIHPTQATHYQVNGVQLFPTQVSCCANYLACPSSLVSGYCSADFACLLF